MTNRPEVATLPVRVSPRAGRNGIDGVIDGRLRVRVAAAPVDGAANTAVERLIADALGVPPSCVRVASGARGRLKVVTIDGLSRDSLVARWPDLGV